MAGIRAAGYSLAMRVSLAALLALGAFPAAAMDLNGFRAQHGRPPLAYSGMLAAAAYEQAQAMASRNHLDHNRFRQRMGSLTGGTAAENVLWGCDSEDCAIQMWARSPGHRKNMLRGDVSMYGIASARADNGRLYWALELGN